MKRIGDVYIHKNKVNNACHYNSTKPNRKDYPDDINFDLDYLNPEKHVEVLYNDVCQYGMEFVIVAFSAGVVLAQTFATKYKSECLFSVYLDTILLTPKYIKLRLNGLDNTNFSKKITNDKLKILQQKIRDEKLNEDARKLIDLQHYLFAKYAEHNLSSQLPIKTISFINLNLPEDAEYSNKNKDFNNTAKIENTEELKKDNGDMFHYRYLINKTHNVFQNSVEVCDQIINAILLLLDR